MCRIFSSPKAAVVLLVILTASCGQGDRVKLGTTARDVVPHLMADLGLAPGSITNQLNCLWDVKREPNGVYYYIENRQEHWQVIVGLFGSLYGVKPRIHREMGRTNEYMFYGVGRVSAMTGILRQCREHSGESTNSFCITISTVGKSRASPGPAIQPEDALTNLFKE